MNQSSVTKHRELMNVTAERFSRVFGEANLREALDANLEGVTRGKRHETIRSRLESRSPLELLQSNPADAIKRRLLRLGFSNDVVREAATRGATLERRFDSPLVGLERIMGRNELLAIRYLDAGQRAGRAVGRVVIRSSSRATLGFGTGSMISPSLMMTNNHVLDSAARAGNSLVEFNYQFGLDGNELARVTFQLRPDFFFTTSPVTELDLTIVAVAPDQVSTGAGGLSSFGFNPLSADRDEILAGESVTIIQHPGGDRKQIALRENRVLRFPNTGDNFLYYETDTTPGSSGAPVFNDQWEVVALHHSGFPERDNQGRILTPDGQLWREEMGDERIHWIANEGIRVAAIRDFLSSLGGLSSSHGALRDRALNPQPIPPDPQPDERRRDSSLPTLDASSQPHSDTGTAAVWNIPLSITVNLGAPGLAGPVIAATNLTPVTAPTQSPVGSSPSSVDEPSDNDFETAKRIFADAGTRPYYDAEADEEARNDYYSDVSSTLNPAELFDALSELVSETHDHELSYKPMLHLYPWVDLQPNSLNIRSVYSDQTFDPIEFISRDFEVARARQERLRNFRMSESAGNPVLEASFLESLEAQLPFNCEHVVPQSWFQKKQPMRGDLHHLFACESGCNSFRSNVPYFDFADFREAIRSDCGKRETNKFEPNSGKGAVARATLYFLLRYPGEINATSSEYTVDRLAILLQWHNAHPVTDYERHRNQAIFEVQGNRNPLIDRPEWGEHISFSSGLG